MEYELALKLKNAGFPQCEDEDRPMCLANGCWRAGSDYGYENSHNPTLSELINSCRDYFNYLKLGTKQIGEKGVSDCWYATAKVDKGEIVPIAEGFTPEEAVAALWLALNEKK